MQSMNFRIKITNWPDLTHAIEKDGLSQLSGLVEQGQVNVTTSIEERRL